MYEGQEVGAGFKKLCSVHIKLGIATECSYWQMMTPWSVYLPEVWFPQGRFFRSLILLARSQDPIGTFFL